MYKIFTLKDVTNFKYNLEAAEKKSSFFSPQRTNWRFLWPTGPERFKKKSDNVLLS